MDKKYNKPNDKILKEKLSALEYDVTQNSATEKPFDNEFWDFEEEGIYVDIVSREPLFSSHHKYDAGCRWPNFYKSIDNDYIVEKLDTSYGMRRTEVRSKHGDSHLGHIFNDGPHDKGGMRYCINSAALRFINKADLEKEGYGEYIKLFE